MVGAFLIEGYPVSLELGKIVGDLSHVSLKKLIDFSHFRPNNFKFSVSHI